MLQETFIRWHRASDGEIQSTRAFLVTIVSRLCINHLQSARVQREEYVGQWLPEPLVTESNLATVSNMDPLTILRIDESLSMAFLVLLERLNPVERAVFLLHEVFEYDHAEIARTVGKDEANCRQILRRARQHIAEPIYQCVDRALRGPFRRLPMMTIFGEKNDPLGFQPRWKQLYPDAPQVVVPRGNHFPMCDAPDLVASSIRSLCQERTAASLQ